MVTAGKFETHEVEGGGGEMYASKLKLSHKKSMRLDMSTVGTQPLTYC